MKVTKYEGKGWAFSWMDVRSWDKVQPERAHQGSMNVTFQERNPGPAFVQRGLVLVAF
jgi:hypothetical protein